MNVPDANDVGASCVRGFPESNGTIWKPLLFGARAAGFWRMSNEEVLKFANAAGVPGV